MEKKSIMTMQGKIIIGVSIAAVIAGAVIYNKSKTGEENHNNMVAVSTQNENVEEQDEKTENIELEEEKEETIPNESEEEAKEDNTTEDSTTEDFIEPVTNVDLDESDFKTKQVFNAGTLNVRSGPDKSYDKVGSLRDGQTVDVFGTDGDWSIIKYNNEFAYVSSEFLTDVVTSADTAKFNNVLWSYSTKYQTGIPRAKNVELASSRINNTIIRPGEEVSYKKLLGEITTSNGFVDAPVMVNGVANKQGVGGGVCQVSSTLHVAALKSGLTDIVSRNHSGRVSYTPAGWDAVISDGQDLKIRNTYDETIMISSYCSNGKIVVEFKSENPLLNGKTYDLRTQASNGGLTVKLNVVEIDGGSESVVFTRTSHYVK